MQNGGKMGIYAITGASGDIGAATKKLLETDGHKVINIDLNGGDICVNLAKPEGRQTAIDELHKICPDGLDGMICCAGVPGACGSLGLIVSLNYFGTVALAKGVYDLLEKKHGSCVVTSSNTISQGAGRTDIADLLNNIEDEARILELVKRLDASKLSVGNSIYVSTKYALARWVRRISASWAANGVRINAIAPGNVNTAMTATMSTSSKMALNALPIPTKYGLETLMDPIEIAEVMVFLVSPKANGINGNVLFVDGGTDALLNSEKVY